MAAHIPGGYGTFMNQELCWQAIRNRDASQDGIFFFGVTTTGVFCRPSCAARRPLRHNVRFYRSSEDAQRAGLRACKRCRPLESGDPTARLIEEACRYIETHRDEKISLELLARRAGLSRFHFQRRFKARLGVTPKQYHEALRVKHFKEKLRNGVAVTRAIYDAGYESSSTVYKSADAQLGMTPNEYRSAGGGVHISYVTLQTDLGLMMIAATDRGVCFLQFGRDERELANQLRLEYPRADVQRMHDPQHGQMRAWAYALRRYVKGAITDLEVPTDVAATAFQRRVWQYLQSIPRGEVRSYGEVARAIGRPEAVRAVAGAVASNPVAVLIPCHRVIRSNGELGGYRWGKSRKRRLLDAEKLAM
jgi:AraC family transcriptional regulator, regulatory protein of adaptative response / methylated-DNA-[protein]-cysteine methyltransferase